MIDSKSKKLKMLIQMDIPRKMLNEKSNAPAPDDALSIKKQGSKSVVGQTNIGQNEEMERSFDFVK